MTRIFITGATGVIGRRVVPQLIAAGHRVTAVGRTPDARARLEQTGATATDLDLFDPVAVRQAVTGHDAVINLATHLPRSSGQMFLPWAWRENDRVRRVGSRVLVDAALAAGIGRFVQESFAPIYVDGGDRWIDESWPRRPARYNRSIVDAERSAERFTTAGGAGVVLRFAMFYGPDARHVPELITAVRKGWVPLPGSPEGFLSSVSHDDAASAVLVSLELPAGSYNVADDEPLRRREFVGALAQVLGVAPPRFPPGWVAKLGSLAELLARSQRMSNRRLREASGWVPRYPSAREGWAAAVAELAPVAA